MPEVKRFGVTKIRDLAKRRVSQSSLRAVAEEIGISFSGLRKFIEGADPHAATTKKLAAWYTQSLKAGPPEPKTRSRTERADVDAAIERIASYLAADGDKSVSEERGRRVFERLFGVAYRLTPNDRDTNRGGAGSKG